jgi:hypothetical protein
MFPHVRFIERVWKRLSSGGGGAAERAELDGDLPRAIRLWMAAGAVDDAARVMLLRGDAEADPRDRLQHYTQAAATATPGSPIERAARARRAKLTVSLARDGALSAARRTDVVEAASDLERAGEVAAAAEAYALAGDTDGEARALAKAGEVERLEDLLTRDQARGTRGRLANEVHAEIDSLTAVGRRREALALAEASPDDPLARSRAVRLRGARIAGSIVRLKRQEQRIAVVLGSEVTIGRADATLNIASSALSRRHALLARSGGRFIVRDLGSRNGTQLRGQSIPAELEVGEGVILTLGVEVPLALAPSAALADALAIEVAGERYVAPLGDARLGVGSWHLATASDGWVELVTSGGPQAFTGGMVLAPRITLLRGDGFSCERVGDAVLRIEE